LAERRLSEQPEACAHQGVHPEVVEAAALAHDLGHPPFGHVAEYLLNDLVTAAGDSDGFEGNAQTFRILSTLSLRFDEKPGLDLTRATLAACLKYPWLRVLGDPSRSKKWGAYRTEVAAFTFARERFSHDTKTAEAEIMDWADDVAYSVHDLEDLHRCGLIPWTAIKNDEETRRLIVERAVNNWFGRPDSAEEDLYRALDRVLKAILDVYSLDEQYDGSRSHRIALRQLTSNLIRRYGASLRLKGLHEVRKSVPVVIIDPSDEQEVRILKQITRDYLIEHPSLVAQQEGQKRIVSSLYTMIYSDATKSPPKYLPRRLHYLWDNDIYNGPARATADCISSLTEAEIIGLHKRLHGTFSGSVLDPIVR
jgi:dGTPase